MAFKLCSDRFGEVFLIYDNLGYRPFQILWVSLNIHQVQRMLHIRNVLMLKLGIVYP